MKIRRLPLVRQKGVKCSVSNCNNWRISNDLCGKHNMAMKRYGSVYGKTVKQICKTCKAKFTSTKNKAGFCSLKCYNAYPKNKEKNYKAGRRWINKNKVKATHVASRGRATTRNFRYQECCIRKDCPNLGERHHPDYSKPYQIVWLCRDHHKECHANDTEGLFTVNQITKNVEWEKRYLKKQEGDCHECGKSLKGLELYRRDYHKYFCSLECSEKDYYRQNYRQNPEKSIAPESTAIDVGMEDYPLQTVP